MAKFRVWVIIEELDGDGTFEDEVRTYALDEHPTLDEAIESVDTLLKRKEVCVVI